MCYHFIDDVRLLIDKQHILSQQETLQCSNRLKLDFVLLHYFWLQLEVYKFEAGLFAKLGKLRAGRGVVEATGVGAAVEVTTLSW
jgi:hypothetical protein